MHIFIKLFSILMVAYKYSPAEISMNKTAIEQIPEDAPVQRVVKPSGSVQKRKITQKNLSIQEVLDNGEVIVLTDGTVWRVSNEDTDYTSGWLGPAIVVIKKKESEDGTFIYFMTNTWTNKTVRVIPIE